MIRTTLTLLLAVTLVGAMATAVSAEEKPTAAKKGWVSLFDGKTLTGWQRLDGKPVRGWAAEDGVLQRKGGGGSIYTEKEYSNFVLELEWRINKGGNSGVKYRMTYYDKNYFGPEFQILGDADVKVKPNRQKFATGALYELVPVDMAKRKLHAAGQWNKLKIVADGSKIQHWINGAKVMEVDVSTEAFRTESVAKSKFKKWPHYAQNPGGRIMLQEHGGAVGFRNIRLRELPAKKK